MIKDSSAMEDTRMIEEDVIEEHNGVYGGKWHIVSTEGFELPEGLEYLKNSWEGSLDLEYERGKSRTHKYVASIKVSGIPLKNTFEGLAYILGKFEAYDTNLELKNCIGNSKDVRSTCLDKITYYARSFSVHGCQLTFKELASIMYRAFTMSEIFVKSTSYNLSENFFIDKNPRE